MPASELPIDTSASALDMANSIFGSGISVVSATYTGATTASGIYSSGDTVAPVLTPSDTGVILSTGLATDITNSSGAENVLTDTTTDYVLPGDAGLDVIAGVQTFDAAILETVFIPTGDMLTMQVVFSSEEYLEYVNSGINDSVGIWVNGVQVQLPVSSGDISIDDINDTTNSNLFIDNTGVTPAANTEMDGLTVTLTLKAPVNVGVENTLRIGIADGSDGSLDSNLLIAGNSVQTSLIAIDDSIELFGTNPKVLDVLGNDTSADPSLTITEINGQPIATGQSIALATGETITLNANGTLTIQSDGVLGVENFTYTVADSSGNLDVAYVTATTSLACFVAGSKIMTPKGRVRIETLKPGDLVQTADSGPQPLRWIGSCDRLSVGKYAPILFKKDALGEHDEIALSPNHRVLVQGYRAELLFGADEVLVKAKDLVNDLTITARKDGKPVKYIHLLFDRHEIVNVNGMESESYHPGACSLDSFDQDTADELLGMFPDAEAIEAFGRAARLTLRHYEAVALMS